VETAADGFIRAIEPKLAPCRTDQEGVFVAGAVAGPKDIPDSIIEAGAAALEAAAYLRRSRQASGSNAKGCAGHTQPTLPK
jgi:heterodisulfide reductase subunit A